MLQAPKNAIEQKNKDFVFFAKKCKPLFLNWNLGLEDFQIGQLPKKAAFFAFNRSFQNLWVSWLFSKKLAVELLRSSEPSF